MNQQVSYIILYPGISGHEPAGQLYHFITRDQLSEPAGQFYQFISRDLLVSYIIL